MSVLRRDNSSEVKSVLSDIGWDEGFSIPVANRENKYLEEEVQQLKMLILRKQNEEAHLNEAKSATNEHFTNVNQELQNTLGLLRAREKEIETENHFRLIAEREDGRLKQEIKRLEKDYEDSKEKRNINENNIFKQTQVLEELKSQMNWDQQALEAWLEESARKDEDAMMLAKYSHIDDGKVKELNLRMEKLMDEKQHKQKNLDGVVTDTMAAQIELDKTAEDFRKAHQDRQNLIKQWESTIDRMQTRDKEMDFLAAQLARLRLEIRQCEENLKEKDNFLKQAKDNNEEEERKIDFTERTSAKTHQEYREAETNRQQFYSELESLKRTVDRTAMDLEVARATVAQLKRDISDKYAKLDHIKDLRVALLDKLKLATESTLTAEQKVAELDSYIAQEKKLQGDIELKLKDIRELRLRKVEQSNELKSSEKVLEAELQGNTACIRNLNSQLAKMDHDSLKQQEILYNQDFEIQQLERRISRMQGERSNDEQSMLEQKVADLQKDIDFKGNTIAKLVTQLKKLQDDIRRISADLDRGKTHRDDLTKKIEELDLYNDSTERELRVTIKQKQDTMVDGNLLKLELKRLRDILNDKSDGVMSHEKRQLQLETAIKERRTEIGVHRTMLLAQQKASDGERSQIRSELYERVSKIDKLRKRYEILMVSMAPPEGVEDHSQAYYVIKAAQEKEDIQRNGDDLDAKIRKAEKEIRALENTVRLMNSRNETYRKSFNRVTDSSDEMEDKEQLEEQLHSVTDKYKYKRRQMTELEEDIKAIHSTLETLRRDEDVYVEMYDEKKDKVNLLTKDIDDQSMKFERVDKQISKYKKDIRKAQGTKLEIPEEKDIDMRAWRDLNKLVIKNIGEACKEQPELREPLTTIFNQMSIPVPSTVTNLRASAHSASSSTRSLLKSGTTPSLESTISSATSISSRSSSVASEETL